MTGIELRGHPWTRRRSTHRRDNPAYALLLKRARETIPAELAAVSRREVTRAQLLRTAPTCIAASPIHLEGHALRVMVIDSVGEGFTPKQALYTKRG